MLPYMKLDVDDKFIDLINYCKQKDNIEAILIFGSYGTSKQQSGSDLDIAVLFNTDNGISEVIHTNLDLEEVLGTDRIDVVCLNSASTILAKNIVENKRILYSKSTDIENKISKLTEDIYAKYIIEEFSTKSYIDGIKNGNWEGQL